jgi:diguanylate cyclase (GGDEF)-like protein/PAS domain S-box-containing protein
MNVKRATGKAPTRRRDPAIPASLRALNGAVRRLDSGGVAEAAGFRDAIINAALDCIVVMDERRLVVEWNQAAVHTFGYTVDETLGRDLAELIVPEPMRHANGHALVRLTEGGESSLLGRRLEVPALRAGGGELLIELTITKVSGPPTHFVTFMRDVSAHRRTEQDLQRAERRYHDLIERLPIVAYLAEQGPKGRWLYVSPEIETLLGYSVEEWSADRGLWLNRIHPQDREFVLAGEERCAIHGVPIDIEYRIISRDDEVVWVRAKAVASGGTGAGAQLEGVLTDITDRKLAEEQLRYRADHDELTSTFNRRRFEEELKRCRTIERQQGAVAILDVDNLKFVNDSLGHAAGDEVIREVAAALRRELRPGETLGRLGGDEFILLMRGADESDAQARAAELVYMLRSTATVNPVTISAGVVPFQPDSAATSEDLLAAADIAMYEAKAAGGDRAALFSGREGERLAWIGRVREAIEAGQLVLHSQPIIELASGAMIGEELLVRMRGDRGELLPPHSFLPTAERFGLVREIDLWVMTRATRLAAEGRTVSVNLSGRSLGDRRLTDLVAAQLAWNGSQPGEVIFEITETAAAQGVEDLSDFAGRLEQTGARVAIDDFGTGFGSLTYLKHLPVRFLKIDMEFIKGMANSVRDRRVVKTIVTIAEGLGMRTIAEGVEDQLTLGMLREYGVSCAQGHYLGRPSPLEVRSSGTLPPPGPPPRSRG